MDFRKAEANDVMTVYDWANDPVTRSQSFNTEVIAFEDHITWFENKLKDNNHQILIFSDDIGHSKGMVRFDQHRDHSVIGINVAPDERGKGYATPMLSLAIEAYSIEGLMPIYAYIKEANIASVKSFSRAGFKFEKKLLYNNVNSVLYICK